jgi:hypothetical protein
MKSYSASAVSLGEQHPITLRAIGYLAEDG